MSRPVRDDGVTIVESAFVLPLLFLFVFGLVDLGMWTFNSNKATNAARDGARAGVLFHEFADSADDDPNTPTDRDRIVAAVRDRLPDQTIDDLDVKITCHRGETTIACSSAAVDEDHIRVEVEWGWDLVTPIATVIGVDTGMARGSATMAIVGVPLPGTDAVDPGSEDPDDPSPEDPVDPEDPPEACAVSALTTAPASVSSKGNQLEEHLWVEFTTSGSPACTDLRIELVGTKNNADTLEYRCGCGTGPAEFAWSYNGSHNIWQPGTGTVRVLKGGTVLDTTTFFVS